LLQIDRRVFTHFDYLLPLIITPIIAISFYLILEVNPTLATKQVVYFSIGFIIFFLFFLIPWRKIFWVIPFFYWINIALLVSVQFFGVSKLGAKRWIEIPFTHFMIQPSEIMKPALILMIAYLIKTSPPDPKKGYNLAQFLKFSIYIIIPFVLILKQPDLGTALILLMIGFGVLFIIGINYKIWVPIVVSILLIIPFIYNNLLHDYQKKRINDFLGEKPSYHVQQSIIAIGSGGVSGKDKEEATQTHLKFLPIAVSDFIFAFYVERFGFIGALVLLVLYLLLILHLFILGLDLKGDYFAQVVAFSLALMFFIYVSVNIAMTIGLAPVVGVPLPLFSYGGSSFVTFMILIGILENLVTFRYDQFYNSLKITGLFKK